MQQVLIERFGGRSGVQERDRSRGLPSANRLLQLHRRRSRGAHGVSGQQPRLIDGNKRIAFAAAATLLEINGFYIDVDGASGCEFIYGSMDRHEFRFSRILDWLRQHVKPLL